MNIIEVSESVKVFQDNNYYLVNSVCVNLGNELLFVDTGINPVVAAKFRKEMQKEFNQMRASLTITHANGDHYMGLEAFMDLPIVVPDKFMEEFRRRTKSSENTKLRDFKPTKTFASAFTFGSDENSITFILAGGHTEDSCYGYFPKEKILIAGDNIVSDMPQYFLHPDADLQKFINCLKQWVTMEIDFVVPGHGNVTTPSHIENVLHYSEELYEFLVKSKQNNLKFQEVLNHKDLPEYFESDPENWILPGIKQLYSNLRI